MIQFSSNLGFIRVSQVAEKTYPYDTESWSDPTNIKLISQPAEIWVSIDPEEGNPIRAELVIYARKGLRGMESGGRSDEATGKIDLSLNEVLGLFDYQDFSQGEQSDFMYLSGEAVYDEESDVVKFEGVNGGSLTVSANDGIKSSFMLKDFDKTDPEYQSENAENNPFEKTDEEPNYFKDQEMEERFLKRLDFAKSKFEDVKSSLSSSIDKIKKVPRNYYEVLGIDKFIDELMDIEKINALEYWFGKMTGDSKVSGGQVLASKKEAQIFNRLFNKKLLNEVKNEIGSNLSEFYKSCLVLSDIIGSITGQDVAVSMNSEKAKEAAEMIRKTLSRYMDSIKRIEKKIGGELSHVAGGWKEIKKG